MYATIKIKMRPKFRYESLETSVGSKTIKLYKESK